VSAPDSSKYHPRPDRVVGAFVDDDESSGSAVLRVAIDDQRLRQLGGNTCDVVHADFAGGDLFEGNTARIAFRRDTWLRGYDYDFMELLAPQLTRRMVEAAQKGEGADPGL
jgi:hypothetical protein